MLKKIKVFILLAGLITYASSCKLDSLNNPIIISLVDKEFSLDLWENLQSLGDPLEIHFETIADENCLNSSIVSFYKKENRNLSLSFFEILQPENCIAGMAPAKGFESIHSIANDGSYPIQIELQDVVNNTGSLIVTSAYYKVEMNEDIGIKWKHTTLFRVPQNTLWGYITYMDEEQELFASNFINTLENGTFIFNSPDGYYGHFELDNSSIISVRKAPVTINIKIFIRTYDGSPYGINELFETFENTAPEGMELRFYDGKGNEW